jgi:glycosyltransferase involved in cell wall biosynthesis
LAELIQDPEKRRALGLAAKARYEERFSPGRAIAHLAEVLDRVARIRRQQASRPAWA